MKKNIDISLSEIHNCNIKIFVTADEEKRKILMMKQIKNSKCKNAQVTEE